MAHVLRGLFDLKPGVYTAVEEAVQERQLPDIEISRKFFNEGGIASAQREYLRVSRDRIAFDICSAPYGQGHFFSWWLAKIPVPYGLLKFLAAVFVLLAMWSFLSAKILRDMFGLWPSVALFVVGLPLLLLRIFPSATLLATLCNSSA